jgi:hypothetical protein
MAERSLLASRLIVKELWKLEATQRTGEVAAAADESASRLPAVAVHWPLNRTLLSANRT